jgi:hypothetical protein
MLLLVCRGMPASPAQLSPSPTLFHVPLAEHLNASELVGVKPGKQRAEQFVPAGTVPPATVHPLSDDHVAFVGRAVDSRTSTAQEGGGGAAGQKAVVATNVVESCITPASTQ